MKMKRWCPSFSGSCSYTFDFSCRSLIDPELRQYLEMSLLAITRGAGKYGLPMLFKNICSKLVFIACFFFNSWLMFLFCSDVLCKLCKKLLSLQNLLFLLIQSPQRMKVTASWSSKSNTGHEVWSSFLFIFVRGKTKQHQIGFYHCSAICN